MTACVVLRRVACLKLALLMTRMKCPESGSNAVTTNYRRTTTWDEMLPNHQLRWHTDDAANEPHEMRTRCNVTH